MFGTLLVAAKLFPCTSCIPAHTVRYPSLVGSQTTKLLTAPFFTYVLMSLGTPMPVAKTLPIFPRSVTAFAVPGAEVLHWPITPFNEGWLVIRSLVSATD